MNKFKSLALSVFLCLAFLSPSLAMSMTVQNPAPTKVCTLADEVIQQVTTILFPGFTLDYRSADQKKIKEVYEVLEIVFKTMPEQLEMLKLPASELLMFTGKVTPTLRVAVFVSTDEENCADNLFTVNMVVLNQAYAIWKNGGA